MKHSSCCTIHKLEITNDILCGRGGLAFFVKYLERIDILGLLLKSFKKLKKNAKGLAVEQFLKQILCFFFDGTSRHLTYYDELATDEGYAAAMGNRSDEMVSSHAVKRFFRAFGYPARYAFTKILHQMFLWRLQQQKPDQIVLTIDTMVLDNDEAQHREGCDPNYKKVKVFQPLQVIWEGKIVDAIFRRGKRHSNYGGQHFKMLEKLVMFIRKNYRWSVPIIVRMDSGFLDEELFVSLESLSVGFIATGKIYKATWVKVSQLPKKAWKKYDNGRQCWKYASFEYKCDSWEEDYRALYSTPMYEEQQQLLEFARPDNIIFTNLEKGTSIWDMLSENNARNGTGTRT